MESILCALPLQILITLFTIQIPPILDLVSDDVALCHVGHEFR